MDLTSGAFWAALGSIILANVVLSGDNAVVIALAARSLPPQQQKKAIFWGSGAAIVMRIVLTLIAVEMLKWPWLKVVGAVLLVYIGVSLLQEDEGEGGEAHEAGGMIAAIRTILVADLVMSVDNVIAIAGAAQGAGEQHQLALVIFGLLVSIPIIVWGSQLVLKLMDRFPVIILLGGMLLGWIAGTMAQSDPALATFIPQDRAWHYGMGVVGALLVLALGKFLERRRASASAVT